MSVLSWLVSLSVTHKQICIIFTRDDDDNDDDDDHDDDDLTEQWC